jgi:hypothetical protein
MSVLDFLFEGKPPPSVTSYGSSTTSIPKWLSDYTQGVIARGNAIAGEGYQPYQGPRIADFTTDQQKGFDLTRQNVGSYVPGMDMAQSFEEQAAGSTGMGAANPFLQRAGQAFPEAREAYMDPYIQDVINKSELDARRFYNEDINPKLNNQFTAAGQYGSTAHMREAERAARELTEGLQTNSLAARSTGYKTAGDLFGADATRFGQLGETAGKLAGMDSENLSQIGRDTANMASARYGLASKDAGALGDIGEQQRKMDQANYDTAYGDFQAQRDYPREQVDWLNKLIKGTEHDTTSTETKKGPVPGLDYGPSGAESIGSFLATLKGMGTKDGDFSWGNIFGSGGGDSGDSGVWDEKWPDLPVDPGSWEIPGSAHGGLIHYAGGGRVNTEALDSMLTQLRTRAEEPSTLQMLQLPGFSRGGWALGRKRGGYANGR